MATKPTKGVKIKDGRLVRTRPYKARNKELKVAREEAAWKKKSKG